MSEGLSEKQSTYVEPPAGVSDPAAFVEDVRELMEAAWAAWDDYVVHGDDCFVRYAWREGEPRQPKCDCGADRVSDRLAAAIERLREHLGEDDG